MKVIASLKKCLKLFSNAHRKRSRFTDSFDPESVLQQSPLAHLFAFHIRFNDRSGIDDNVIKERCIKIICSQFF